MLVHPHDGGVDDQIFEVWIVGECREDALPDTTWLQRLKRTNTLFHLPKMLGRSRHGEPVRAIQSTASTNIRLFAPVPPGSPGLPTHSFSIRAHCRLLRISRI